MPFSAIAKVVAVVEALPAHRHLTGIARATGLPASTVHRILRELVALGWVRESEDREYAVGPVLLGLAPRAAPGQGLPARAAASAQAAASPWGS
jgi:DNA-binding IclR family transcriptional regulator